MLIGYMRVSSVDDRQSVDLQRDALIAAGVDERHLHRDKASGTRDDRPDLLAHVSPLGWEHINLTGEYRWPKSLA